MSTIQKVFLFLILSFTCSFAASVDSLNVPSASMKKTLKAAVVLPKGYLTNTKASYPVIYLLHGGSGHFSDWLKLTPDKMLVQKLADQYNFIIVMPEGEEFSWYLDSPVNSESQFETHIIKEVLPKVDESYRTIKNKNGRAITGLSMGGHGAMYLSARHPELFCAAGSMSGALDMNYERLKLTEEFKNTRKIRFQKIFGMSDNYNDLYAKNSVVNMADLINKNGLSIIIDCGVDDFLLESNREMHRRLLYNHTPHDYTERPGGHTWGYWENSLPNHLIFFNTVFKTNGVLVK